MNQFIQYIRKAMLFSLCAGCCITAAAAGPQDGDNITVSGVVTDAATGMPIAGVRVEAYGNNRYSALTDDKGQYQLTMPDFVTSVAMSVDGYNLQQKAIGTNPANTDAQLYPSSFLSLIHISEPTRP